MNEKLLSLNSFSFMEGITVIYQCFLFSWVKMSQSSGSCWILLSFKVFIHPLRYSLLHHPSSSLLPARWVAGTLKHSFSIMSFSFHFVCMFFYCQRVKCQAFYTRILPVLISELSQSQNLFTLSFQTCKLRYWEISKNMSIFSSCFLKTLRCFLWPIRRK